VGTLLALIVAAAGCTAAGAPAPIPRHSFPPPQPIGVSDPASVPSAGGAAPQAECDPTVSLRPPAPMPQPGHMPPGSAASRIVDRGRLVLGTDQNIYLFAFRNPATGRIEGFDVDIAREIVKAIFGDDNDQHIQIVALTADERIRAVEEKRVDLLVDTTTITCGRLQQVGFSTVYYDAGQRILASRTSPIKSINDLGNQRVCAASGTTSISTIIEKAPTAHVISAKSWTDCMVLLQQGQADAITTDDTILYGLAAQDPTVHVVGDQFNPEPYGLAMAKANTDLVRFVNGVLDRIRADGTWRRIYEKWLPAPAPQPPLAHYGS
jgi:polar amino acid transport system substrate-binding protein